jgi:hypothetical protein
MESTAPLGIDPLIAEARRRARRRQGSLVAVLAATLAVAATLSSTFRPSRSAAISARPAGLNNAVALGTLVSLDRSTAVATFRISCGWHVSKGWRATTKLRPGLYTVSVRGGLFNNEIVDASGPPGNGVANEVNLSTWERYVARPGWTASLHLGSPSGKPYLSDGPTTDICNGVLG